MSNVLAGVFGTAGLAVLLGIDVHGISVPYSLFVGLGLLLLAAICLDWSAIWDQLTGDHSDVVVGRDTERGSKRRLVHASDEPPAGFFGRHPLEFGFEREDNNSLVVNGKPHYGKPADQPYMRDGQTADGRPLSVRRTRTSVLVIKSKR